MKRASSGPVWRWRRIKPLPPSIREKQRYLSFRVRSDHEVEIGDVVDHVWKAALDYLGTKGASETNFWVMGNRFDREEQTGVIRVRRGSEGDLRAALALADQIGGNPGFLEITRVSGSIKALQDR